MKEKFSRHVNEQYRWSEALRRRLVDLLSQAKHFRMPQEEYLNRRSEILAKEKRLTRESLAGVMGYVRGLQDAQFNTLFFCYRLPGKPESAEIGKWDTMSPALKAACENHTAECAHTWDSAGQFPYTEYKTI